MSIVWLSSYPKSGNTYLRFLLFSYIYGSFKTSSDVEEKVKDLHFFMSTQVEPKLLEKEFSNRAITTRIYRRFFESETIKNKRLQRNREIIMQELLQKAYAPDELMFMKTHLAFSENHPLSNKSSKFICIIRNPRDVLKSGLRYLLQDNASDEQKQKLVEEFIFDYGFSVFKKGGFGTWIEHISSWLNASAHMPGIFVKYESLKHDTQQEMERILNFLDIEIDAEKLEYAIQQSSLDSMRKIEKKEKEIGSKEQGIFRTYSNSKPFVGSGKSNQSLEEFGENFENIFSRNFASLIELFGYS
ncbi:sulfotransferase [[Leptolyngbya] sp. PCC 7376]|uniref:sulfotransferase domain-containing protein n=1 Tax=[Leptolyngbya] sp. PCC 7376 TaxID=111781 RepID=UPI00029ECD78|nr:sulfotransferase domain-containing protein [[Leptolyngbya] sp. PCC 7376]AFY37525.1 sulfotransferase [[Leptolyngbya] sp. PCC 7376]